MAAPTNHFALYLSQEGDCFSVKDSDQFPEQEQALACRTHEQVLAFLETLKNSKTRNQLDFYHFNNTAYNGHMGDWPKDVAHPCTLETQIDFIRYKIGETVHGVRNAPRLSPCVIL